MVITLGINMGASKTIYSIFSKINEKYISNVLLLNNSFRTIPSVICYTKNHRLFGNNAFSSVKQYFESSYNNIPRLINFEDNQKKREDELKYFYAQNLNKENYKFNNFNEFGEKVNITSDYIIADYLSLINDYYFEKEKVKYEISCLSVPDFFNDKEKEKLTLICESIGMKEINIYNESSAITIYYGYTKYRDLFVNEDKKIDENIVKYILFIDIGYSKCSFILSKFKYDEFTVSYVIDHPNLGGRNFDEIIYKHCISKFKKEKIEISNKMKYKLLEEIQKKRIQLSVNNEATIYVEKFFKEEDLKIEITRKEYETMIKNKIEKIEEDFSKILKFIKINEIKIDYVELAGEITRTPIIQKVIEKKSYKISKTILIDECTSVGAALLGNFYNGNFPIKYLKNVHGYKEFKNHKKFTFLNQNSFQERTSFKNSIYDYVEKQKDIDLKYNFFISKKTEFSKLINNFKVKVDNNQLEEIKKLEKKLRNIEINDDLISDDYANLKKIVKNENEELKNYENKISEIEKEKKNFISQLNVKREKNKLMKEIEKKNYELECFIHDFIENEIIFNDGSNKNKNKFIENKIKEEREFSKKINDFIEKNINGLEQIKKIKCQELFEKRKSFIEKYENDENERINKIKSLI
jgi:heat shock protein